MELKLARFLLPLLLVLPIKGTASSKNGSSRGMNASKRVVRLYSGTRPQPIVCDGEGFQADPSDCTLFHRCMKNGNGRYVSFRFQCGPGTIYDPDKEICNHPQNTKRTDCGASLNVPRVETTFDNEISREVPSPLNANHLGGTEKTTTEHKISTQTTKRSDTSSLASQFSWLTTSHPYSNFAVTSTNLFANKQQQTKSPKLTSIKREVSASLYSATPQALSSRSSTFTTAKIDFQNSPSMSQLGDMCKSNGFMGDSDNCRKFYRCISNQRGSFIRYEFLCTDPTIWDDDKQACNHAWAVKRRRCGRGGLAVDNNDTRDPTQSQLQINYGSKVTQTQTQINDGSVVQNQTQINYERNNKSDDTSVVQNQTQISHGDAVSQIQTQINYGDAAVQTQLQIDHSKESSQAQTQVSQSSSTTKTTQFSVHQPVSSTNNRCTESGFMGDSEDCKIFYRCVDNGRGSFTRYEFSCGEGTVWDPKLEACNHAWAVKECGGKGSSETTTQITTKTTQSITKTSGSDSTLSTSTKPLPTTSTTTTTTQSYYLPTDQGNDDSNDIPYGNQLSLPATNRPIEQVSTGDKEPQSTNDNKCRSSGFMGDQNDCKKFYRCVDNGNGGYTRYDFTCGEGTVWDQNIEACNHAWAVKNCGQSANVENKTEISTISNVVQTSSSQPETHAPPQNDDYDTGYGQQSPNDETPSIIKTTTVKSTTTILQSSSPSDLSVGDTCTTSGFMGDNNNCKKFYRCVENGKGGYTRYEFSCGEGTVWDSEIQACNHAWAVEKCGGNLNEDINKLETTTRNYTDISSSPTPSSQSQGVQSTNSSTSHPGNQNHECHTSGFMGDTKDCKKFYRCVDNGDRSFTRYEFACGEGTVWDQSIEACNHPWAVSGRCSSSENYSNSSDVQLTTQSSTTSSAEDDQGYNNPTTQKTSTSTGPTSKPSDNQCVQEGFYGDNDNCNNFYRCVDNGRGGFIKYEFSCGEGTVWNQDIQACDHKSSNNQCNTHSAISTTVQPNYEQDEMVTESTTKTTEPSTANTETSTSKKPESENKCENEGFYGDPKDCKKFYRCVGDGKGDYTRYDFICGDGTIWDQEILTCNYESSNNKCNSSSVSVTTITTTNLPETGTNSSATTQNNPTTQRPGTTSTISGADRCTMEGFYANTNDCKKFYRCVDNGKGGFTKYDFDCGEGTVWVQEIQACDYDNGLSSCSNNDSSSKPQTIQEQRPTTTFLSTSQETTESQSLDEVDDEYPSGSSTKPGDTDDKCTSEGFFGNNKDCTRFYRCVDNGQGGYTKYDFTCGEGTAWDSNIQTCNHINEVEKCQNTNEGQSQPKPDGESSQTTESTIATQEASSNASSKPSSASNDECEQEGYFGNTKDCKMFYRCVDNGKGGYTKYDFTCADGTIWDQDVTTCNHPQDVTKPSCKNGELAQPSEQSSSTENSSATSSTSTTSQSSQETTESNNQGSSNCSEESSSEKPSNQNVKCEKAGYFANPDDCKKFYRCVDWDGDGKRFSVYHFECGEGTIWDPQLETCNHEDSVYPPRDCSGSQSQSGNVSQTNSSSTTTTEKTTTSEETSTTESGESTTEESTTQSSTTNENTTQPVTTEKTTTQEPSTSKQTTTEETTTTQQSTSSEKTTTEQSTTSEKTTTQPTTSEQTTTEQMTTTQQQVTQETVVSQQTTTELTTSSETTTTEQSTTNDQTTQQTNTSEQSTVSNSSEQTTTQQTSTTEVSSATTTEQQTTTTEQQTTTTEQQTTTTEQQSTTTEQSSEQNTTEQQQTTAEQEKTTTESSNTTTESSESTTESAQNTTSQETASSDKNCPETEDDQYMYVCPTSFRRHPKYCNMFYQCTEDNDSHDVKVTMFKCPNNTIYDESKTQCVEEDKADKKCDGQTAQRHRVKRLNSNFKEPVEASRRKMTCSAVGYYPFEADSECSGIFLKCQRSKSGKLRGYVYRCPEGYTYWSISKRCEKNAYMKGCKQSDRSWRDRWEIPVEKKNIAK